MFLWHNGLRKRHCALAPCFRPGGQDAAGGSERLIGHWLHRRRNGTQVLCQIEDLGYRLWRV